MKEIRYIIKTLLIEPVTEHTYWLNGSAPYRTKGEAYTALAEYLRAYPDKLAIVKPITVHAGKAHRY